MSGEDMDQEKVAGPEYVNTQEVTRGVAVADIAAYVEGKRREDGFKGEFKVNSQIAHIRVILLQTPLSHLQRFSAHISHFINIQLN